VIVRIIQGVTSMQFTFTPVNAEDAHAILAWQYEGPYAVYNIGADADEANVEDEMLDRRSPHYAVRDENGELVGFFGFGSSSEVWDNPEPHLYSEERTVTVGLGMRPDMTGKGLGLAFFKAGLAFAQQAFQPSAFRLYVLPFNERAIRVYERAGFRRSGTFMQHNEHGDREFIEMRMAT
jgi:ribosomal-protein-alanine N-acetyltransferase